MALEHMTSSRATAEDRAKYQPNPDDNRLTVEFYNGERNGNPVEMVRIADPNDRALVRNFRALDISHVDPVSGEDVTYAARFAPQYAAFRAGTTQAATDRIEKLQEQIAQERAKQAGADVDMKAAEAAAEKAVEARRKQVASATAATDTASLARVGQAAADAAVAAARKVDPSVRARAAGK